PDTCINDSPGTTPGRQDEARDPRRDLRLELCGLAWRVLSGGVGAAAGAGVREQEGRLDRDQRLVLLAAAPDELPEVVRGDAARLRLRRQGEPLHHAYEEAEGRRASARQLLRLGRVAARGEARPDPLAVPVEPPFRPSPLRGVPFAPAEDDG